MRKAFTCLLVIVTFVSLGQDKSKAFKVSKYTHDFGTIEQSDGDIETKFVLVNISGKPVAFVSVDPECSCTEPKFEEGTLQPGDTTIITAGYLAATHPGEFKKGIRVQSTLDTFDLSIVGDVNPKPLSEVEVEFPAKIGALRFESTSFNMGRVFNNKASEKEFVFFNDSDGVVRFVDDKMEFPSYLKVSLPDSVAAKSHAKIKVVYDAMAKNDFGYAVDWVNLVTDEKEDEVKEFAIRATIEEFFPKDIDLSKSGKLECESSVFQFGTVKADSVVSATFVLVNNGVEEVLIRKIKPSCTCVGAIADKETVKPGKTIEINATFDSTNRSGTQSKSILVYTNDPHKPVKVLRVKGKVN